MADGRGGEKTCGAFVLAAPEGVPLTSSIQSFVCWCKPDVERNAPQTLRQKINAACHDTVRGDVFAPLGISNPSKRPTRQQDWRALPLLTAVVNTSSSTAVLRQLL